MFSPKAKNKLRIRLFATALGALAVGVAASGCDVQENADVANGRELFLEQCGRCHILAEAGTQGRIGPDLDAAFADARRVGQDSDTIEGIVEYQIRNPRFVEEDDPTYMPANLVEGDDARDVAAYVASVAGVPGAKPPQLAPPELFAQQCGTCHTLKAAGSTGNVGPNLDQVLPGQSAKQIEKSIVDPNAEITAGFQAGVMPATFGQSLTEKDLMGLVKYLLSSVGG